jgi:DsbC/DsbD-like thiol-disulfide interchange protein
MRAWTIAAWLLQAVLNPQETPHLQLKTSASRAAAAPGAKVTLQLDVTPKPKMHVYAPGQDGYIPIQLTLTGDPAFTAAKAKYPAGEKYVMPALNETQLVYAAPFRVTQEITVTRAAAGTVHVKGSVRYQACDEAICYLPKTVPVEWTIAVATPRL